MIYQWKENSQQLVDVVYSQLKLVSITYSYPYQLITILDVQIGYNHADIAAQKKTCRFSLFKE